jgi:PKD domain
LLVSAVSAAAIAALVPALAGADGGGVRTTVSGHTGPTVSAAMLDADVPPMQATTRTASGQETHDDHAGTSAQQLVVLAGIDPAHVTSMAIERPSTTGAVVLTHAEIVAGFNGDPLGGVRQATFRNYDGAGGGVQFFRPMRDALDANQPDELDAPTGADLVVQLTTDGPVLAVTPHADPNPAPNGTPVRFTATGAAGATYAWDFGDGQTGAGAAVDHTYAGENQSYTVTVTALTSDGGSGAAIVHVQVGAPGGAGSVTPAAVAPAASAGGGGASGGGGSAKRVGGGRGGPAAPSQGLARGAATSPPRHRGAHAQTRSGTAGTTAAPRSQPARPAAARARARRPPASPAPHATGASRISGVVLAGEGAAADLAAGTDARAQRAAARAAAAASQPLSWWLLAGLGLALLLGLGAARESGVRLTSRLRPS